MRLADEDWDVYVEERVRSESGLDPESRRRDALKRGNARLQFAVNLNAGFGDMIKIDIVTEEDLLVTPVTVICD